MLVQVPVLVGMCLQNDHVRCGQEKGAVPHLKHFRMQFPARVSKIYHCKWLIFWSYLCKSSVKLPIVTAMGSGS